MKAIVWTEYGSPDVLQLKDIQKPIPKDNEMLIRIVATTATSGDCEMRGLSGARWYTPVICAYVGLTTPRRIKILGMELAGVVESIGKDVKLFKAGDHVFAATSFANMGTYAEYITLPETSTDGVVAIKPSNMTFQEAAAVPVGGLEALHFIRQAHIQTGQKILINGAGGTIGTFAVQLAKYFGAEVTGVDSTEKLEMLRLLGADHTLDYTQEDFTTNGVTYDVILDMIGKGSYSRIVRSLKPNGRLLFVNPNVLQMIRGRWTSMTDNRKVKFSAVHQTTEDLNFLKEMIQAGKIKSVIDRCYPLQQTAEAHRYIETGRKKGHIIITMEQSLRILENTSYLKPQEF